MCLRSILEAVTQTQNEIFAGITDQSQKLLIGALTELNDLNTACNEKLWELQAQQQAKELSKMH